MHQSLEIGSRMLRASHRLPIDETDLIIFPIWHSEFFDFSFLSRFIRPILQLFSHSIAFAINSLMSGVSSSLLLTSPTLWKLLPVTLANSWPNLALDPECT